MADSLAGIGAVDAGEYAGLGIGRDLKVSHAVDAAGAVGRVVDTGLARFIARHALPVARRFISNSTGGADLVAVAIAAGVERSNKECHGCKDCFFSRMKCERFRKETDGISLLIITLSRTNNTKFLHTLSLALVY